MANITLLYREGSEGWASWGSARKRPLHIRTFYVHDGTDASYILERLGADSLIEWRMSPENGFAVLPWIESGPVEDGVAYMVFRKDGRIGEKKFRDRFFRASAHLR